MAYDEGLAERVRQVLSGRKGLTERKMFGGIAFMLDGKMCCGVIEDDLVVRVGPERYEEALAEPHARPMDFTGRSLRGFVFVGPDGCRTGEALAGWVRQAADFVQSLLEK
jgi:TfoX/Sxy family transcriptional regulator of competence genes